MGNVAGSRTVTYGDPRVGERRVRVRRAERIVLECNCGERLNLIGPMAVQRSGRVLECVCGERFTLAGRVAVRGYDDHGVIEHWEARSLEEERRYSWLEDRLEWLEGKEAREEYYARLEQAASW
jgi:hypothetical protein